MAKPQCPSTDWDLGRQSRNALGTPESGETTLPLKASTDPGTRAADRTVGLPSMRVQTPYKQIILHDLLHITLVTYCNTMGFMTTIHHTATRASKVFIWGYALAVECMRVDG